MLSYFPRILCRKKCAIVSDGDLQPSDADPDLEGEDDLPPPPNLKKLENEYVRIFACQTTFERAATLPGTLEMFAGRQTTSGHLKSRESFGRDLQP